MTRVLLGLVAGALIATSAAQAAVEPPPKSKLLETVNVPVQQETLGEFTKEFKTKVKTGRLYAVRFSGSYTHEGLSFDPAYCFSGGSCEEPSQSQVAILGMFQRLKNGESRYDSNGSFYDENGGYPDYQDDHAYTMLFEASVHTLLKAYACSIPPCGDLGAFEARLYQRPFPQGFVRLWLEDCRTGDRQVRQTFFNPGGCQRFVLQGETGPKPGGKLQLQERKNGKWVSMRSSKVVYDSFPRTNLAVKVGKGRHEYRAGIVRRGKVIDTSNTIVVDFVD